MTRISFIKQHLLNNTITLNVSHLRKSTTIQLESRILKPIDICMKDMVVSVRSKVRKSTAIQYNARVVFEYKNKQYLLIYNK